MSSATGTCIEVSDLSRPHQLAFQRVRRDPRPRPRSALERLLSALRDADTGQRGFLPEGGVAYPERVPTGDVDGRASSILMHEHRGFEASVWHRIMTRMGRLVQMAVIASCTSLCAKEKSIDEVPQVIITGLSNPVEKSYRKVIRGMDYFERARTALAPDASLRFKLLPRKRGTDLDHIVLKVIGSTFAYDVPIAADQTFVLARDPRALREDAVVSPNRQRLTMTWRTDIRTPGLPPDSRRLGDLRLECQVGLEAGLVSNSGPLTRILDLFVDPIGYCERKDAKYLFFAERPLFSVTLVDGARREVLPIGQLYAMASDDPDLEKDLPYCDCEILVDRTYFLPLGDHAWPNETRVEFEYMDDRP